MVICDCIRINSYDCLFKLQHHALAVYIMRNIRAFFAGCAITYYRINLGFWWGVGLHVFNNLPGIIILISQ